MRYIESPGFVKIIIDFETTRKYSNKKILRCQILLYIPLVMEKVLTDFKPGPQKAISLGAKGLNSP